MSRKHHGLAKTMRKDVRLAISVFGAFLLCLATPVAYAINWNLGGISSLHSGAAGEKGGEYVSGKPASGTWFAEVFGWVDTQYDWHAFVDVSDNSNTPQSKLVAEFASGCQSIDSSSGYIEKTLCSGLAQNTYHGQILMYYNDGYGHYEAKYENTDSIGCTTYYGPTESVTEPTMYMGPWAFAESPDYNNGDFSTSVIWGISTLQTYYTGAWHAPTPAVGGYQTYAPYAPPSNLGISLYCGASIYVDVGEPAPPPQPISC